MTTPYQLPPADNSWPVRLNRWTLFFSRRYLTTMLTIVAILVSLPFAAPVLMRLGLTGPGEAIYSMYSVMCHQYSYRSVFLFGQQAFYPRASVGMQGLLPYEYFLNDVMIAIGDRADRSLLSFELNSKAFLGNEQMGYKVAVCQRDIAIYGALLVGGLIYSMPRVRRHLRPVPLWLYVLLGLGPIGLDGVSQLLSYPPFELWPIRESTPLFRFVTGALFGLMNAWLAFPYLEASARETIKEIEMKFEARRLRQQPAHRGQGAATNASVTSSSAQEPPSPAS